jgi:DNA processing protein
VFTESDCRLILFACIEPADVNLSKFIFEYGAKDVYYRLIYEKNNLYSKRFPKVINKVSNCNLPKLKEEIAKSECQLITPEDSDWPLGANDLDTPPIALLIKGRRDALKELNKSISIVGSRKPTNYGVQIARYLSRRAAECGVLVVSGGAVGIDSTAHVDSIAINGSTISVQAAGFNHLYPKENIKLFTEIMKSGLLISEVMPDTPSKPHRFLIRNRLIAALSKATVVVEAEYVSGSIRTAIAAAEIFRPVFAVPGEVTSPLSQGCHRLIAERIADIATNFEDILDVILPLQIR